MTSIKDGLQTANTSDIGGSEYKLTVQFELNMAQSQLERRVFESRVKKRTYWGLL